MTTAVLQPRPGAGALTDPSASAGLDPRAILTSIGEAVYDWNVVSDTIVWGVNAGDIFGLPDLSQIATGKAYCLAVEPGSGVARHEIILDSKETDAGMGIPYRTRYALKLGGQMLGVEDTGRWFADSTGQPALAHGVVRIDRGASHPSVAGLKARERAAFLQHIGHDVAETSRLKRSLTLICAAIEDLGRLNDEMGCDAADAVIEEVILRIHRVMRRRDRLVRYSGNRFAVALLSCPTDQADIAADRLARSVQDEPYQTAKGPVRISLRLGAATAPENATDASALLHRAEEALGHARSVNGRRFVRYDPAAMRSGSRRTRITPPFDVLEALNERRIGFALQPVVEAGSRARAFSEILLRYTREDGQIVNAGDILPQVERAGLITLLDIRMLELAADYLAEHPAERVSMNISPATLESADFLGTLAAHLGRRPGIESRLIVEVTETIAVRDPDAARRRLDAMKALGVAIAIDDFGAGHTSFRHLRNFPVDILKIDGAFVQNLSRSSDDRFFVRTLVDLAHHLGITTVAEWVESEETAKILAEWGVDFLQGDYCGRPELMTSAPPLAVLAEIA